MTPQPGKQTRTIHILPDVSSKDNQTMEFSRYLNIRLVLAGRLVPNLFLLFLKNL